MLRFQIYTSSVNENFKNVRSFRERTKTKLAYLCRFEIERTPNTH